MKNSYDPIDYLQDIKMLTEQYKEVSAELKDICWQIVEAKEAFTALNQKTVITDTAVEIADQMIDAVWK